jgi:hypothetical protein
MPGTANAQILQRAVGHHAAGNSRPEAKVDETPQARRAGKILRPGGGIGVGHEPHGKARAASQLLSDRAAFEKGQVDRPDDYAALTVDDAGQGKADTANLSINPARFPANLCNGAVKPVDQGVAGGRSVGQATATSKDTSRSIGRGDARLGSAHVDTDRDHFRAQR